MKVSKWLIAITILLGVSQVRSLASPDANAPHSTSAINWVHIRQNLSSAPNLVSAYPDLAHDNGYVAVVWTQGYDSIPNIKHYGGVYLRWVSEDVPGWQLIEVDTPGSSEHAAGEAVVGLHAGVAHVVWALGTINELGQFKQNQIWHARCTCALHISECVQDALPLAESATDELLQIDVVVDGNGNPHVVWVDDDKIYYSYINYSLPEPSWSPRYLVSGEGSRGDWPAITHSRDAGNNIDYAHIAWTEKLVETEIKDDNVYEIRYRQAMPYLSQWGSIVSKVARWDSTGDLELSKGYLTRNVSIAAFRNHVYIAWDFSERYENDKYMLGYTHSLDYGMSWPLYWPYLGSYPCSTNASWKIQRFDSTDSVSEDEYIWYLRPNITVDDEGTPCLAWHSEEQRSAGPGLASPTVNKAYEVFWSNALVTASTWISWSQPMTISWNLKSQAEANSGSPKIVVIGSASEYSGTAHLTDTYRLHMVYQEILDRYSWDVFYNSDEASLYHYHYLPIVIHQYQQGEG